MSARLDPGKLVEYRGRKGVTVPDFMACCHPSETPVVFDGTSVFEGIETAALTIIGDENAEPNPEKCGAGRGADCCVFLTCGPKGFECDRHTSLRYALLFRDDMSAKGKIDRKSPERSKGDQ